MMKPLETQRATDLRMLAALERSEEITDEETEVFADMRRRLDAGQETLTRKQRDWAEAVYRRHGLDRDEVSLNLASTGRVAVTEAERRAVQDWTASLGRKVLKPPGRR